MTNWIKQKKDPWTAWSVPMTILSEVPELGVKKMVQCQKCKNFIEESKLREWLKLTIKVEDRQYQGNFCSINCLLKWVGEDLSSEVMIEELKK